VIRNDDASRRHAEVYFEAGRYWLLDLGSTNGTFVNGVPVTNAVKLSGGDRIDIGSSTITFCEVSASVAEVEDEQSAAQTMISMRLPAGSGDAFQGDLAEIPTDALLQVLEMGRKSGLLEIQAPDHVGLIWLDTGRLVHAETEKQRGFDAAVELVSTNRGRFRFEPGVATDEQTIVASITELLLEASRIHDEDRR
jgi:pSer/pThr/pTyr-binding forkhead associated (FHA) protein